MIKYTDTRATVEERLPFTEVVLRGLAPGGGLFVPESLPSLGHSDLEALAVLPYWQRVAKVFDRFESHTLGTRHRGVGLGLSIVRSFVELHGGRVELRSAPGAGTTVTCAFPVDGSPQRIAAE